MVRYVYLVEHECYGDEVSPPTIHDTFQSAERIAKLLAKKAKLKVKCNDSKDVLLHWVDDNYGGEYVTIRRMQLHGLVTR